MVEITEDVREALDAVPWTRLECREGRSAKFWSIRRAQRWVETWWGRIDTRGQKLVKGYATGISAFNAFHDSLVAKLGKGYQRTAQTGRALPGMLSVVSGAPTSPPRRPQVDPLTGRVAVYAQRDVLDWNRRVVHPRGFKQMLLAPIAAEVVTGSEAYGYWHPDGPMAELARDTAAAIRGAGEAERMVGASAQAGSSGQAPRGVVAAALEEAADGFRRLEQAAQRLSGAQQETERAIREQILGEPECICLRPASPEAYRLPYGALTVRVPHRMAFACSDCPHCHGTGRRSFCACTRRGRISDDALSYGARTIAPYGMDGWLANQDCAACHGAGRRDVVSRGWISETEWGRYAVLGDAGPATVHPSRQAEPADPPEPPRPVSVALGRFTGIDDHDEEI